MRRRNNPIKICITMLAILLLTGCRKYQPIEIPVAATKNVAETTVVKTEDISDMQPSVKEETADEVETTWAEESLTAAEATAEESAEDTAEETTTVEETTEAETTIAAETTAEETTTAEATTKAETVVSEGEIGLNSSWKYAEFSKINSGKAVLYRAGSGGNGITVCVNAGHGTSGGESTKTLCHPDGTAKVTGGTTSEGQTKAVAVSAGTTFLDGTPEYKVTLKEALKLKEKLLARGYNVLMIREGDDVQLDNVARTVIANNIANCHVAVHWDSTTSDKGAYFMSVPNVASYKAMEPVKSHWEQHNALGSCLVSGLKDNGIRIFESGDMQMDLTQTSYSTVPSVDIELGDRASDHSDSTLSTLAEGLADGIDKYFGL